MATFTLSISSGLGLQGITSAYVTPIPLSVSAGIGLQGVPTFTMLRAIQLTVSASIGLSADPEIQRNALINLSVAAGLKIQAVPTLVRTTTINVSVATGFGIEGDLALIKTSTISVSVSAGLGLTASASATVQAVHVLTVSAGLRLTGSPTITRTRLLSVRAGLGISASPSLTSVRVLSVSAGFGLIALPVSHREITLSVSAGVGLAGVPAPQGLFLPKSVAATANFVAIVSLTKTGTNVSAQFGIQALVSCQIVVSSGAGDPGSSSQGGPSTPLIRGISGDFPLTFAETSAGLVLMANGVDPMIRWDGLSSNAQFAGVVPPATSPVLTASGSGLMTGLRFAFCRFIDSRGNYSNLSPIGQGVQCGRDQSIDNITSSASGVVTITSRGHGLSTNQTILIQGVQGLPINGLQTVGVSDLDNFILLGVSAIGVWAGGGYWIAGSTTLTYSALPSSSQTSVTALQLLRNLEGDADAIYVDATLPVGTSSYTSTLSDNDLARNESVVVRTEDGRPLAFRYALPPNNRPFIANYLGRIFAAGDAVIYAGCVSVISGTNQVQGIGTKWTQTVVGRMIYVKGSSRPYEIASIDTTTQVITLTRSYSEPSSPFVTYLIRLAPAERKVLHWSEADNPEAWPPWNALGLPEDNDEITGLFVKGTYLYIAENRHIWRFQFSGDPARTGHAFLSLDQRGLLSQRVLAQADDKVFLLDESGIYSFDGGSATDAISDPIQVVFYADSLALTMQVDWTADQRLWHASLDPTRTIVRWFVTMIGQAPLTTAICFNYRQQRWWLESYPVAVSSSCVGTLADAPNVGIVAGSRRAFVGAEARTVLVLEQDALDMVADTGTLRGTATSADAVSLTDIRASFAPSLGGAPIRIVSGKGAGQARIISTSIDQTIVVVAPWDVDGIPDTTSVYQIGGVSWEWRSGWLDLEIDEAQNPHDLVMVYEPMSSPATATVQLLYDHETVPEAYAMAQEYDGVSVSLGSPDITFDLTAANVLPGYRHFKNVKHSAEYSYSEQYVQIQMAGVGNNEVVRIYQVGLRSVDQEGGLP